MYFIGPFRTSIKFEFWPIVETTLLVPKPIFKNASHGTKMLGTAFEP